MKRWTNTILKQVERIYTTWCWRNFSSDTRNDTSLGWQRLYDPSKRDGAVLDQEVVLLLDLINQEKPWTKNKVDWSAPHEIWKARDTTQGNLQAVEVLVSQGREAAASSVESSRFSLKEKFYKISSVTFSMSFANNIKTQGTNSLLRKINT